MNWYIAKIVFQIICGDGNHRAQFDEQLRLMKAADWQDALCKAKVLGENEQERFLNDQQQWVQWQFVNVSELILLKNLQDGLELYYNITEPDDAEKYVEMIHQKARDIAVHPSASFSSI